MFDAMLRLLQETQTIPIPFHMQREDTEVARSEPSC